MGEERSIDNPNAAAIQPSQIESYLVALDRMVTSLGRFDDDGRAVDTAEVLKTAKAILQGEHYPSASLTAQKIEAGLLEAETAFPPAESDATGVFTHAGAVSESPGVYPQGHEKEGDPLPPFSPMALPDSADTGSRVSD